MDVFTTVTPPLLAAMFPAPGALTYSEKEAARRAVEGIAAAVASGVLSPAEIDGYAACVRKSGSEGDVA